jgi:serine phosphatase RsbU (regulator of sigma subunit)
MKLPFRQTSPQRSLRRPETSQAPSMQTASVAALYRGARVGGDFFDFQAIQGRLVFFLLDIAGKREEALDIAAGLQEVFRTEGVKLFQGSPLNEADALSDFTILLNRTLMQLANGVRYAPAFLGCYEEELGTLFYINAGHTPGILKDRDGITLLAASGLPLGLFSHATHDAQMSVLEPSAALLVVSKGLVESRRGNQEFGLERVRQSFEAMEFKNADDVCSGILNNVQEFTKNTTGQNDISALSIMRSAVASLAAANGSRS